MASSDDTRETVRIGLVGLGGHGRTTQQACEDAPNLEVVAVFDPDKEEAEAAASKFGCYLAVSYEELIRRDDLQAVVLVTPNHLHKKQVMAALEADLHVFVEKPIATTLDEGMAMISKAEAKGRVLMVGHNMRFWPTARRAKECIAKGELGQVISTEIHFSSATGLRLPVDSWRRKPDVVQLLPVTQLAIHAFDLVHYLLGFIEEVTTYTRSALTRDEVVDSACAIFRVEGGSLGTMVSNYCSPELFELRIAGTKGTLRLRPDSFRFQEMAPALGTSKTAVEELDAEKGLISYALIMQAFGDAVLHHTIPETDGWVGLQALAVVEAMQRSSSSSATPWSVERFKSVSLANTGDAAVVL
ncbi:MAG: Gfo/Idh/MocA family protein [Rhodothermales bacterium]